MAIVEIKKSIRPNTSVLPINRSTDPKLVALQAKMEAEFGPYSELIDEPMHRKISYQNGDFVVDGQFDASGLILTRTATHANLEVYSRVETLIDIEFDYAYKEYTIANGITHPESGQYIQTGIDAPFKCTTTYNFPDGTLESDSMMLGFARFLQNSNKLESFTNTASQIIAVHHYLDSADFSQYHFKDFQHIGFLYDAGAIRTISYAML
jgi:hypothetical protein